jgi:anti-anti-sigma factor
MTASTVIELDQEGPASILRIEGDITSASEPDLMAAYGLAAANGSNAVVLDFSKLAYMNSGGIGLLVTLLVRARRSGGRLVATGLSDHYRQIFSLTRLDEAIEIHDDRAAALAAASAQKTGAR